MRCYRNGITAPDLAGCPRLEFVDEGLELGFRGLLADGRNGQAKTSAHAD